MKTVHNVLREISAPFAVDTVYSDDPVRRRYIRGLMNRNKMPTHIRDIPAVIRQTTALELNLTSIIWRERN
jgi:hypothetical protein